MQYTPVKTRLGCFFKKYTFLRVVFYKILDLILLRAWHIHKEINIWAKDKKEKSLHILDAGAGFGQYAYFLGNLSKKWNILAVDNETDYVCSCNAFFNQHKNQNILYRTEDLTTFQEAENFDLVLSVDVIEQISEDETVLSNFYNSLKHNGMLLLAVPSDKNSAGSNNPDNKCFCDEQIRNGYSLEEITKKLKKIGYKDIDVKYTYGKSGETSWRLSMKYPMMAVGTSRYLFSLLPFYYLITYPVCFILNMIDTHRKNIDGNGLLITAWKR